MQTGADKYEEAKYYWLNRTISLQALASEFGLNLDKLKRKYVEESWDELKTIQIRASRLASVERAKFHEQLDTLVLESVLLQLTEIKEAYQDNQQRGKRFRSHEALNYAKSLSALHEVALEARGNVAEAISVLVVNGVLPQSDLPAISEALEDGAAVAYSKLQALLSSSR
jgi:hypothetical protein